MSVRRFDTGTLRKPKKLASGFLRVDALLTRTGIFEYKLPNGSIRRELRTADEVFHEDALESFALNPVTDDHPPEMLDAGNAREYQRGNLGESVRRDGGFVCASMIITDASLIAKMEGGKHQVSCGYTCDSEDVAGVFDGQRYDAIQRNIRGNHVAIVDVGRAGAVCAVRMDSDGFDGTAINQEKSNVEEIKELQAKLTAANAETVKQTARADAAEAELTQERTARTDAAAALPAAVKARVALERQAADILGDVKLDGMTESEIKIAVVEKVSAKKLDVEKIKTQGYVDARYDTALERVAEMGSDALANLRVTVETASRTDATEDPGAKARKTWGDAWKSPIPGAATKDNT